MSAEPVVDAAEIRRRAEMHRPTSAVALAAEVRRLAHQGLTHRDIGSALGLNADFVAAALREPPR